MADARWIRYIDDDLGRPFGNEVRKEMADLLGRVDFLAARISNWKPDVRPRNVSPPSVRSATSILKTWWPPFHSLTPFSTSSGVAATSSLGFVDVGWISAAQDVSSLLWGEEAPPLRISFKPFKSNPSRHQFRCVDPPPAFPDPRDVVWTHVEQHPPPHLHPRAVHVSLVHADTSIPAHACSICSNDDQYLLVKEEAEIASRKNAMARPPGPWRASRVVTSLDGVRRVANGLILVAETMASNSAVHYDLNLQITPFEESSHAADAALGDGRFRLRVATLSTDGTLAAFESPPFTIAKAVERRAKKVLTDLQDVKKAATPVFSPRGRAAASPTARGGLSVSPRLRFLIPTERDLTALRVAPDGGVDEWVEESPPSSVRAILGTARREVRGGAEKLRLGSTRAVDGADLDI